VAEHEPEAAYSRRGFYISIGVGSGAARWLIQQQMGGGGTTESSSTDLGFATKFAIGMGVSDRTLIHWTSRVLWLSTFDYAASRTTNDGQERVFRTAGIGGIGVTHFLDATERATYVGGDIGFSTWSDFDKGENAFGFGLCGQIGHEFARHFSVEYSLCWGTAKEKTAAPFPDGFTTISTETGSPLTNALTVNYMSQ
jgi:hypothetical protein